MGVTDTRYDMWMEGGRYLSVHRCNGIYWSNPVYITSTIGAHDFLGSRLLLDCAIYDFKPPTYRYLHFKLE
jgi:hypothetical protein